MKTILLSFFVVLTMLGFSQSVTFTATTATYNGSYKPKHYMAVWVTTANDVFVKTLYVTKGNYQSKLFTWKSASSSNIVDAVTGATTTTHSALTTTWNCTDKNGAKVANGTYKIKFEFTEGNTQGKISTQSIVVGTSNQTVTPANETYFKNISITYTAPVTPINTTFSVDMNDAVSVASTIYVAGSFNNWSATANPMTDANNDGIYDATVSIAPSTAITYKFINGTAWESGSATCGVSDGNGGFNRQITLGTTDNIIPTVCFNTCTTCSSIGFNETTKKETISIEQEGATTLIHLNNQANNHIQFFTLDGKLAYDVQTNDAMVTLTTSSFAKGIYLVKITNESGLNYMEKIVVQ